MQLNMLMINGLERLAKLSMFERQFHAIAVQCQIRWSLGQNTHELFYRFLTALT